MIRCLNQLFLEQFAPVGCLPRQPKKRAELFECGLHRCAVRLASPGVVDAWPKNGTAPTAHARPARRLKSRNWSTQAIRATQFPLALRGAAQDYLPGVEGITSGISMFRAGTVRAQNLIGVRLPHAPLLIRTRAAGFEIAARLQMSVDQSA